ncbi:MAG TPA: glycosyltransferase family 4 protein [Candidatus Paceibacterota bacterium]
MRILFITNSLERDNGGGVFSRQVIEGLTRRLGAHTTIFTVVSSDDTETIPIGFSMFGILKTLWRIRREAKQSDVMHVIDVFPYGILGALAIIGLRKKFILTAVGSASIIPLHQIRYAFLARWCLRRADAVVAISSFTRDEILKVIPALHIEVINPGIELSEFERSTGIFTQVAQHQPYLLSVGTVRWRKGYRTSVAVFAKTAPQFPKLHYIIIGRHPWPSFVEELKSTARAGGVEDRLIFLDSVNTREELLEWYRGAELFCLFSENAQNDVEGFGIVFTEAAAAGLPVVGRKHCGVDDAVDDGKNGILVDTPEDFEKALNTLLSEKALALRMGAESLNWAQKFSVDAKIQAYSECYRRLGIS